MSIFGDIRGRSLPILALAGLAGCSLIMNGTSQELHFDSEPPGATFTVGGKTDETPSKLSVPKDDYVIVFSKPGYRDTTFELKREVSGWFYGSLVMGVIASSIDVVTGAWKEFQTTDIKVTLEPDPESSEEMVAVISSKPPGAEILVSDTLRGTTPAEIKLLWKGNEVEKEIALRLARYRTLKVPLRRSQPSLEATLEPDPLTVKVYVTTRPAGAEIRMGGRGVGRTPSAVDVVWVPNDPPKILELAREGYHPARIELKSENQREASADLSEIVVEEPLRLKMVPAQAEIEVDGVAQPPGTTEPQLRWSESLKRHSLRFWCPGYVSKTMEVTRDQATSPLEIRLVPLLPRSP